MDEKDIEHRLTKVETQIGALEERQDNLDALVSTVKVLADREERVEDDVKEIKSDVKKLTEKPGQRWDSLVDKIIWAVAGAVLAFLLAKIGL